MNRTGKHTFLAFFLPAFLFMVAPVSVQASDEGLPPPSVSGTSSFRTINLAENQWFLKRKFDPSDAKGFDPQSEGVKPVETFPMSPNRIFKTSTDFSVNHFALMTRFEIREDNIPPLAFSTFFIGEGWAVYINGHLLRNEIYLNPDGTFRHRRSLFRPVVLIPGRILEKGTNTLVLHMVGESSVTKPPLHPHMIITSKNTIIGETHAVMKRASEAIIIATNSVFLFFGLFFFVLFLKAERNPIFLYFSLFVAMFGIYDLMATRLMGDFFPDSTWLFRIRWVFLSLLSTVMSCFLMSFFIRVKDSNQRF